MRFRTMNAASGLVLQVEDGDGVLFAVPLADKGERHALIRKALAEGVEAIRPDEPAKKKATKK